jgi:hypothetical protein
MKGLTLWLFYVTQMDGVKAQTSFQTDYTSILEEIHAHADEAREEISTQKASGYFFKYIARTPARFSSDTCSTIEHS